MDNKLALVAAQRPARLAEAKASYESMPKDISWDGWLQEWRVTLRDDPPVDRAEFVVHMLRSGMRPAWADAIATELGIAEWPEVVAQ